MSKRPNQPPDDLDEIKKLAIDAIEQALRRPVKRPPRPTFIGLILRPKPPKGPLDASPEAEVVNQIDLIVPPEEGKR